MDINATAKEASKLSKEVGHDVSKNVKHYAAVARDEAAERLAPAQDWAEQADGAIREALRAYPVACLFAALTVGYSLGRMIAKR